LFTIIHIDMNAWTPGQIKSLRDTMKLTQKAFSERIGVTREYVNYLEKGVRTPSKTMCILLYYIQRDENENEKESGKRGKSKRYL
jgi:DNA-binding transcriptional regulator YiaG